MRNLVSDVLNIRPFRPADFELALALEKRTRPYRAEDQAAVEAMYERARGAKESHDPHWMPIPPPTLFPSLERADQDYLGFWVAVRSSSETNEPIVGMVGVLRFGQQLEMPAHHPLAQEWLTRNDVAELRRLRVDSEVRRHGIGTRLCQTVIDWSRANGYRKVALNTTSAQIPAIGLYRTLGFREVGRSFIGVYELIWQALDLT